MQKPKLFVTTLLMLGVLGTTSWATTYEVDPVHSKVEFTIRHLVSKVAGGFNDFKGTIVYDPNNLKTTSFKGTIFTGSIDTNNEKRDNHLRSADFFDVSQYPTITFESTKVQKEKEKLMVMWNLTMHGVTKAISFPVEVLGMGVHPMTKAPQVGFEAELVLKRSDFGVNSWTDPAKMVGDEVTIHILIEANGKTP